MSHFEILYLFFRTIEVPKDEKKPQFQIYFKSEDTAPFREENTRTVIKLKVLPQTKLYFKLVVHKSDDIITIDNSLDVKDMNLTPFEPKTFCLPFATEKGENIFFIYDVFSYYVAPEDAGNPNNLILLDFEIQNLSNIQHLIDKVEKPIKKRAIGFSMVEYELSFVFMKQNYSFKFFTNNASLEYSKNVFATTKSEIGPINVKVIIFCIVL